MNSNVTDIIVRFQTHHALREERKMNFHASHLISLKPPFRSARVSDRNNNLPKWFNQ
jgi:hypothetical protein